MDVKTRIKMVDDLTNDISEKLGQLTRQGALSVSDSVKIIKIISDKQFEWMKNNFTPSEINEFISE